MPPHSHNLYLGSVHGCTLTPNLLSNPPEWHRYAAICLILCDLCYIIVYLSLPCHISISVFSRYWCNEDLSVFTLYYKFDPYLSCSSQTPWRPTRKAHLFLLLVKYQETLFCSPCSWPKCDCAPTQAWTGLGESSLHEKYPRCLVLWWRAKTTKGHLAYSVKAYEQSVYILMDKIFQEWTNMKGRTVPRGIIFN